MPHNHNLTRRGVAGIIAASCIAIPASASAMPYSPPTATKSDAAQSGGDARNPAPHDPIVGDDIMSHPAMPGMPNYEPPTTIEVVRPERTIVRDLDQALPLILSSTALLLALTGLGVTLVRARIVPRPGRSTYEDPALETDERGIHELGDDRVAWFRDPDGNTFAIEQAATP